MSRSRSNRKRSAQRAEGERRRRRRLCRRRTRKAGFTLLEVMAAVALLAILYTVLARVAIEGLRGENDSQRRLEAALLADSRIAESFTSLSSGFVLPDFGHKESAEGDFTLALDVTPFIPPAEWGLGETAGAAQGLFAPAPGVPGAQALRTVQLTVSWLEGAEKRQVSRTIFLLDFARVSAMASTVEQNNPEGSGNGVDAQNQQPTDAQNQQGLQDLQDLENDLPSEGNQ